MGAHPLSGVLSWQGIVKYRPLCRILQPTASLHFANLPQAWDLVLIYSWVDWNNVPRVACLRPLLWETVGLEPTTSEANRFRVWRANEGRDVWWEVRSGANDLHAFPFKRLSVELDNSRTLNKGVKNGYLPKKVLVSSECAMLCGSISSISGSSSRSLCREESLK